MSSTYSLSTQPAAPARPQTQTQLPDLQIFESLKAQIISSYLAFTSSPNQPNPHYRQPEPASQKSRSNTDFILREGIATALYGTNSPTPSTAFDIITYTTTPTSPTISTSSRSHWDSHSQANTNTNTPTPLPCSYGIALITYPNFGSCATWELLSHIQNQSSVNAGMERLLADLRVGMGGVMGMYVGCPFLRFMVVHVLVLDS
jgi:hypothetical protein